MKKLIYRAAARNMGKIKCLFFDCYSWCFSTSSCSTWLWNGFLFIVGPHMLVGVFLHTFFHMCWVGIDTHTIFCKSLGMLPPWVLMDCIQIHPPLWLEEDRVAGRGGQSDGVDRPPPSWMSSELKPENVYVFIFLVFVSKRKADSTWTLKLSLSMNTRMEGKMLCNCFFSLIWML